jgi:hypothetical protein
MPSNFVFQFLDDRKCKLAYDAIQLLNIECKINVSRILIGITALDPSNNPSEA